MKFPKAGDLRVKASIDFEGDYVANVQVYRGFWTGWRNLRSYYAVGSRDPAECLRLAKIHVERAGRFQLGIIE